MGKIGGQKNLTTLKARFLDDSRGPSENFPDTFRGVSVIEKCNIIDFWWFLWPANIGKDDPSYSSKTIQILFLNILLIWEHYCLETCVSSILKYLRGVDLFRLKALNVLQTWQALYRLALFLDKH